MATRVSFEWYYSSTRIGGWSENFHNLSDDTNEVESRANKLLSFLDPLKAASVYCPIIRLQREAPTFGGLSREVETGNTPSEFTVGGKNDGDQITTSIELLLAESSGLRTLQWLGGNPDQLMSNNGRYDRAFQPWNGRYIPFDAVLTDANQGWAIRQQDKTKPKHFIVAFDPATGVVTTDVAHGLNVSNLVRLTRTRPYQEIAGEQRVLTVPSATTFTFVGYSVLGARGPISKKAAWQIPGIAFYQITKTFPVRCTSHKRGRPFGQYSGRRRTQKKT